MSCIFTHTRIHTYLHDRYGKKWRFKFNAKKFFLAEQCCKTIREVPELADRRLQTRRMPLWNALDCFIRENLVLPVMYDSVHSVLVKQHGYIQWTNCTKNTLLGN